MDINTLFHEALLAQAAYADLDANITKELLITKLKNEDLVGGVTQAQAEYFVDHFTVVQQDNNPDTGFSATLFKNIDNQEYHIAMRGSSPLLWLGPDWYGANAQNLTYGMAYDQVADLINFYLRLTSPTGVDVAQFSFKEVILSVDAPAPEASVLLSYEFLDLDGDGQDDNAIKYLTFQAIDSAAPVDGLGVMTNTHLKPHWQVTQALLRRKLGDKAL